MSNTRKYKLIDCLRLPMAVLVVVIHTTTWRLCGLTQVAVPFFFLASGFFLFLKMPGDQEGNTERFRKWTLRALKMYLVWMAVYLPFTVYGFLQDGLTARQCLLVFVRNLLFRGEFYMSWPLWYLLGLVWAGTLFYILSKIKCPLWTILAVGVMLFFVPWAFPSDSIFWKFFCDDRLFRGFLFISIGGVAGLLQLPPLPEKCTAWISDKATSFLRYSSAVIYLTHMLFAGVLRIVFNMSKGPALFELTLLGSMLAAVAATVYRSSRPDDKRFIC